MKFRPTIIFLLVVFLAYVNYFSGYSYPPYFFWDENYHVASAQKYLHGVFFMEPHAPLGKLLIALGEYLLHPNPASDQFLNTMYAEGARLPANFSFAGYRFFPTLLAALTAPLLFWLGWILTGTEILGGFAAALYLFDNAMIVHMRGAMLEGTQLFFVVLAMLLFFLGQRSKTSGKRHLLAFCFGAAFAAAVCTKATGLILAGLYLYSAYSWRRELGTLLKYIAVSAIGFLVVFCAVWQIHFSLAKQVISDLDNNGYFSASPEYREILDGKREAQPTDFFIMLRDSIEHVKKYEKGVPVLNLCKSVETGSPAFLWPFGGRSINYRWERHGELTQYLYLQINPAVWLIALGGLIVAVIVAGSRVFFAPCVRLKHGPELGILIVLYAAYMAAMLNVTRVMYLYHYFVPLLFCFLMFTLCVDEISSLGSTALGVRRKYAILTILVVAVAGSFRLYFPLTYYEPVSVSWISSRALLSFWDLRCSNCGLTNFMAHPIEPGKQAVRVSHLKLGGKSPITGQQETDEPQLVPTGGTFLGAKSYTDGFIVHAKSVLVYALGGAAKEFSAVIGVPGDKPGVGSVVFEVFGDSDLLYRSPVLSSGAEGVPVTVDLTGRKTLKLQVLDAGDGNNNDRAVWADPKLQ